jgi:hypothetical protein
MAVQPTALTLAMAAGHKLKLKHRLSTYITNHVNITAQRPAANLCGILCAHWWMAAPVGVQPTAHHTRWPRRDQTALDEC